jgi:hypothetical protein
MLTLQVLPTRTLSVKLSVCSLIGPESTSNATICGRAGGARSAIGAVFTLLLVGQPLGPGASGAAALLVGVPEPRRSHRGRLDGPLGPVTARKAHSLVGS